MNYLHLKPKEYMKHVPSNIGVFLYTLNKDRFLMFVIICND